MQLCFGDIKNVMIGSVINTEGTVADPGFLKGVANPNLSFDQFVPNTFKN